MRFRETETYVTDGATMKGGWQDIEFEHLRAGAIFRFKDDPDRVMKASSDPTRANTPGDWQIISESLVFPEKEPHDAHTMRAAKEFGVDPKDVTPAQRQAAKHLGFVEMYTGDKEAFSRALRDHRWPAEMNWPGIAEKPFTNFNEAQRAFLDQYKSLEDIEARVMASGEVGYWVPEHDAAAIRWDPAGTTSVRYTTYLKKGTTIQIPNTDMSIEIQETGHYEVAYSLTPTESEDDESC